MKKIYNQPTCVVEAMYACSVLAASGTSGEIKGGTTDHAYAKEFDASWDNTNDADDEE